ncbi:MAG TPA: hypothetical protein DEP84_23210 [Chloroflexi bacterium]|nr:hypothetical protein [Chloroflexota bacterium]
MTPVPPTTTGSPSPPPSRAMASPTPPPTASPSVTSTLHNEHGSHSLSPEQARGQRLFETHCIGCHGTYGQGGGEAPSIAKTGRTLEEVHYQIRRPLRFMTMFAKDQLSDEEIGYIYAYLQVLEIPQR